MEARCARKLEETRAEVSSPGRTRAPSSRGFAESQRVATEEAAARIAASDAKWGRIHANAMAARPWQQAAVKKSVTVDVGYSYMADGRQSPRSPPTEKKSAAEIRAAARETEKNKAAERAAAHRLSAARLPAENALVAKALQAKTAAEERHDGRWPPGRDPFEIPVQGWR